MKLAIFLVVIALAAVAIASNTTYEQQTLIPFLNDLLPNRPFEQFLSQFEITYWNRIISVESSGYYHFVEFLIRKATHFSGYGLIAIIIFFLYKKLRLRFPGIYAILSVFAIAAYDEFRQTYLDGRTGTYKDVMIDTLGAITFICILKLILFLIKKVTKRS